MTDLERALRETSMAWPATPDLAGAVRRSIAAEPAPARSRRVTVRRVALALLVALGGAFAISPARAAILDWLGLRSVRVERRAPAATARVGAGLHLGTRVTLSQARRRAGFRPVSPRALPAPAEVFFARFPPQGGRVSFVYRAGPGLPRGARAGAGLLVTEMRAQVRPFIQKSAGPGTRIERLRVGGDPAIYLAGRPHGFAYVGADGSFTFEQQRLAGPTLLVERADGLLLRIEGRIARARAIQIARSVP